MQISITPNNREEFLRMCKSGCKPFLTLKGEPEEVIFGHRSIDDNFTYDNMLDHYCDAVDKLKYNGEVAGCRVTVSYHNDVTDGDYATVKLAFCDSSGQPIKMNDRDHFVLNNARSLDTKFLQFMKGRSEAYFTPTIQEIVQRMKKITNTSPRIIKYKCLVINPGYVRIMV